MKLRLLVPLVLAFACTACVTNIHPDVTSNPPPSEPLSDFQHFQLMSATISDKAAHETEAFAKINTYLEQRVGNTLMTWSNRSQTGRTLRIEPHIDDLKYVSGGARFFAGDFAGSSAVVMHLKLTDADTGQVIADPEFYQRAAAEGGTWSFGGTDKGMLRASPRRRSSIYSGTMRKPSEGRPVWRAKRNKTLGVEECRLFDSAPRPERRMSVHTFVDARYTPRCFPSYG